MIDEGLLDLESRKDKAPGGYCETLHFHGRPFIFMNAVGLGLGAGDLAVAGCAGGRLRDAGHEADQEGSGDGGAAGAQGSAVPRRAGLAVRGTAVHVATSSDFSTMGTRRGAVERWIGQSRDVVEGRLTPKGGTPPRV